LELTQNSPYPLVAHGFFKLGDRMGFVMQKLKTPSLADHAFSKEECDRFLSQGLEQLEWMHSRQIYANDIKPENMGINDAGQLVLYDFAQNGVRSHAFSDRFNGLGSESFKDLRALALSIIQIRFRDDIKSLTKVVAELGRQTIGTRYVYKPEYLKYLRDDGISSSTKWSQRLPKGGSANGDLYNLFDWLRALDFARSKGHSEVHGKFDDHLTELEDLWLELLLPPEPQRSPQDRALVAMLSGQVTASEARGILNFTR
jgi:serine/threonine protein kinase